MHLDQDLLDPIDAALRDADPAVILRHVHAVFGPRAALLSGMQRAGAALCHLADRAALPFDVLFVDTGVLHRETLETRDRLAASHPTLRVITLQPELSFAEQTRRRGVLYLTKEGQETCCELRKVEPLLRMRDPYLALVSALMREEGGRRRAIRVVEVDPKLGQLRIHPFAGLTRAALDAYIAAHPDVVTNPLHDYGFPTIGCYPCTTPVRPDEDDRAGRWRHLADVAYCGINPTDASPDPRHQLGSPSSSQEVSAQQATQARQARQADLLEKLTALSRRVQETG